MTQIATKLLSEGQTAPLLTKQKIIEREKEFPVKKQIIFKSKSCMEFHGFYHGNKRKIIELFTQTG